MKLYSKLLMWFYYYYSWSTLKPRMKSQLACARDSTSMFQKTIFKWQTKLRHMNCLKVSRTTGNIEFCSSCRIVLPWSRVISDMLPFIFFSLLAMLVLLLLPFECHYSAYSAISFTEMFNILHTLPPFHASVTLNQPVTVLSTRNSSS